MDGLELVQGCGLMTVLELATRLVPGVQSNPQQFTALALSVLSDGTLSRPGILSSLEFCMGLVVALAPAVFATTTTATEIRDFSPDTKELLALWLCDLQQRQREIETNSLTKEKKPVPFVPSGGGGTSKSDAVAPSLLQVESTAIQRLRHFLLAVLCSLTSVEPRAIFELLPGLASVSIRKWASVSTSEVEKDFDRFLTLATAADRDAVSNAGVRQPQLTPPVMARPPAPIMPIIDEELSYLQCATHMFILHSNVDEFACLVYQLTRGKLLNSQSALLQTHLSALPTSVTNQRTLARFLSSKDNVSRILDKNKEVLVECLLAESRSSQPEVGQAIAAARSTVLYESELGEPTMHVVKTLWDRNQLGQGDLDGFVLRSIPVFEQVAKGHNDSTGQDLKAVRAVKLLSLLLHNMSLKARGQVLSITIGQQLMSALIPLCNIRECAELYKSLVKQR